MSSAEIAIRSCGVEGLAGIGPEEWLGEDGIEVVNEIGQPLLEGLYGWKRSPLQGPSSPDAEPDLYLIEPRGMARGVDEAKAMVRGFQEGLAGRHRGENTGLALGPEVIVNAATLGDEPDQGGRLVGVELIGDKDPTPLFEIRAT